MGEIKKSIIKPIQYTYQTMKDIFKNINYSERILETIADNMILFDIDGNCLDVYQDKNPNSWFINKDLIGKNIWDLLPEKTYQQIYPAFRQVLQTRKKVSQDMEIDRNGKHYHFRCILSPFEGMVLGEYRDITERNEHKIAIEKQNNALQEIQKAALIGNWKYDSLTNIFSYMGHTGIMATNQEQFITPEEYLNFIVPEDRESFLSWFNYAVQGRMHQSIDYRVVIKGQTHYIRLKAFAREHHKDGSTTLEGYIQNITDLQQSRNDITLLTDVINNSAEDIFAMKEDGTMIFANRQFREHNDIDLKANIENYTIYGLNNTFFNNKEEWLQFAASINKGEKATNITHRNPYPLFPEIIMTEGIVYWMTNQYGEDSLWGFTRDISKRVKGEQANKQLRQILDQTIENLPASIVVKDVQNDFRYIYRNREAYRRGIHRENAIGKTDFDYYSQEVAQQKRNIDIEIATTGKEKHWTSLETDKDGKPLFLDKRKKLLEGDDNPLILCIDWDITELEEMKQQLVKAKEKAENSDKQKSTFLANMSHEIRTPLNAIVGFSRIIAESDDLEERKSYYRIIEENNERLLQLINEILDLSKIEAGIIEMNIKDVDMHELCEEIHNAHKLRCPQGVELIFETSPFNTVVKGDKNRIFQVISNLIGNAFKFTHSGSVSYGYCIDNNMLHCHVTDTGMGIPKDKVDKIFERFVKANNVAQGTGLGLSISKVIIERLGGTISVSSIEGEGTTFEFTLPLATSKQEEKKEMPTMEITRKAEPSQATQSSTNNDTKKTILVAEDTDSNFILAKAILGKIYNLVRAKDGMEAVNMFESVKPHLILMDMKMPNLNGLDATRIIREISKEVPIIALTAYAFDHDKQAALDAGCNDFLTKPYTQEVIKEMIEKYIL